MPEQLGPIQPPAPEQPPIAEVPVAIGEQSVAPASAEPQAAESDMPPVAADPNTASDQPYRVEQAPLTDAQVASLGAHRGQSVTPEQREGIDAARARGIHHGI